MDSYRPSAEAAEQAAYHFARLRSPARTAADVRTFEVWLAASPAHRNAFEEIDQVWLKASDLRSPHAQNPELAPNLHRTRQYIAELKRAQHQRQTRRRSYIPQAFALAATLVIALATVLWLNPGLYQATDVKRHYTEIGEQKTLRLDDGTRVMLNTRTTLEAAFDRHHRRVVLLRGQARFDVAQDKSRPFAVEVNDARVTALGTEFDIYKRPGLAAENDEDNSGTDIIVTLLSGAVEVARQQETPGNESVRLKPGQQVVVTPDAGFSAVTQADLSVVDAWRQGKLKFNQTPLERVIAEANRYGGYRLVLANPTLREHKISGVFESGDNLGLAKSLQALLSVDIKTRGQKIIEIH